MATNGWLEFEGYDFTFYSLMLLTNKLLLPSGWLNNVAEPCPSCNLLINKWYLRQWTHTLVSGLFGSASAGYSARFNDTSFSTFSFPAAGVRLALAFSLTAVFDGRILSMSRKRFAIKESCNSETTSWQALLLLISLSFFYKICYSTSWQQKLITKYIFLSS